MSREYHREYYQKNKEKIREYNKKWIKNNRERWRELCKKNQIRKYVELKEKDCIMCGKHFITNQWQKLYCSKECKKKAHNKRKDAKKRRKGFYPLICNPFPKTIDIDFHHIHPNLPFVVPLPKEAHRECVGNLDKHVYVANEWVEFYYGISIQQLLEGCQ